MVDHNRLLTLHAAPRAEPLLAFTWARILSAMRFWRAQPLPDAEKLSALETHVRVLIEESATQRAELRELTRELQQLRQDELRRSAEHTGVVDQLNRLYRRMSARVAREAEQNARDHTNDEESVAALRKRLGR